MHHQLKLEIKTLIQVRKAVRANTDQFTPALLAAEVTPVSGSADFIRKMMKRLNYDALKQAAQQMGVEGLPDVVDEARLESDDDLLQLLHHAMLEVHLEEGSLICPESGRKFPVSAGIPNMLLHEDEVHA